MQRYGKESSIKLFDINSSVYVESFAGDAAVFFAKQPSRLDVINDLNGELINFYRTVVSHYDELKCKMQRTLHSRTQHQSAWFIYNLPEDFTNIQRAWAVWVLSKMGFAGQLSSSFGFNLQEGRHPRKVTGAKEAFTIELRKRLEIATIENDDAFNVNHRTLQRYRDNGLLPFFKIGQKVYYRTSDVRDFVFKHQQQAKTKGWQ